jgi:hypothetical protein
MHPCTAAVVIFIASLAETEKYPTDVVRGVHRFRKANPQRRTVTPQGG